MKKNAILILTFILFLLFPNQIYTQELSIDKSILLKKFKESKNGNEWLVCNKDNSFFKNDSIWIYNHINFAYHGDCCEFVTWSFFSNKNFDQSKLSICKEPPTSTVSRRELAYKVKIKKKGQELILITKNKFSEIIYKVVKMEIVELWEKGNKSFRMKLEKIETKSLKPTS